MKKICILFLLIISLSTQADLKLLNYELGQEFSNSSDSFFKYSNNFFGLDINPNFMINISKDKTGLIKNITLQSKDVFKDESSCNKKLEEFFNSSKNNYSFSEYKNNIFYLSNEQSMDSFLNFHTKLDNQLEYLYEDLDKKYPKSVWTDDEKSKLPMDEFLKKTKDLYDISYSTYQNSYIKMSCKKTSYDSDYFYNEIIAQIDKPFFDDQDNIFPSKINSFYIIDGISIGNKLPLNLNNLEYMDEGSFKYKNFVIKTEKNKFNDNIVVEAYLDSSHSKINYNIKKCFDFIYLYSSNNIDINDKIIKRDEYKPLFYIDFSDKKGLNIQIFCSKDELSFSGYTNRNIQDEEEN